MTTDNVQNGLSDMNLVWDKFYAIELKFVKTMPVRDGSKLLSHPFSAKQIKHLLDVHNNKGGIGLGVIGLGNNDALIVPAPELALHFIDGNIIREKAQGLFLEPKHQMFKTNKYWDIKKLLDEHVKWK